MAFYNQNWIIDVSIGAATDIIARSLEWIKLYTISYREKK